MQKKILTLVTLGLTLSFGFAQSTVNFSAQVGQRDVYWGGSPIANGNQVRVGYFDSAFDINSHLFDLNALGDAWNQFGATTNRTLFGQPGRFSASASLVNPALNVYDGQHIWMWILKTVDNSLPAPDFSNVIGYGLYSSSLANWNFPAYSAVPPANTTSINSSEVNSSLFGSYDASHLYLSPVPEPSAAGLAILGFGLFLLAFRKRDRQTAFPLSKLKTSLHK